MHRGDSLVLTRDCTPAPVAEGAVPRIGCTLPEVFGRVQVCHAVHLDDGKMIGEVTSTGDGEFTVRIAHAGINGSRLRAAKGIKRVAAALAFLAAGGNYCPLSSIAKVTVSLGSGGADEVDKDRSDVEPSILLQKVATPQRLVGLTGGTWDEVLQERVLTCGDRIGIAEDGEEGFVIPAELLLGYGVGPARWVVWSDRDEHRELPCAGFEALIGERRVVGGDGLRCQVRQARTVHDVADLQVGGRLAEFSPAQEVPARWVVAGGQKCIGSDNTGESLAVLRNQSQSEQATPVVAEHSTSVRSR